MNKEHILQEIQRTAKANGGVPLGWRKFEAETGIKEYDWYGHWARWSDALQEAGFVPNQLQSAYDKTELLDRYANFALELGKLPTEGDLRLKCRRDAAFPNNRTFSNRLGTKAELVQQLIEHCRGRAEYEDIVRMCEGYDSGGRSMPEETKPQKEQDGFVYLIKSGRFYKIGKTNAVGRREYEIALQLPEQVTTVHEIRTDDPSGIEAYWHNRFKAKRKKGEWFDLDAADIKAFKRRNFM